MAAVTAGTLLAWLVITAIPASAAVTCTDDVIGGVNRTTVAVGTDSTVALGFSAAGILQVADNPPADLTAAVWAACGALVNPNVVRITGQNNGAETVRLDNGDGVRALNGWGVGTTVTFVDLGSGTDTLTIETFAAQSLGVEFATSVGGSTVLDADWNVEALGTDTEDVMVTSVENLRAVGDLTATGVADNILAAGDGNASTIDITPAGAGPEDITVPGTADGAADTTGVDPRGNLTVPLTMNGGVGNDVLEPGNANDAVIGGAGDDIVVYAEAPAGVTVDLTAGTATGGSGSDTLSDIQSVAGSLFADTLTGSAIDNRLSGCGGDDVLDGGAGNDTIRGDVVDPGVPPGLGVCPAARDGDDTIVEGTAANGSDVIQGDGNTVGGMDVLDYSGRTAALYVAPGGGAVSGEGGCPLGAACEKDNIAADIEYYMLGSGNDTFVGSAIGEVVMGGAGDDTVGGGAGFDYLDLSDGAGPAVIDTVAGTATGSGSDTFTFVEGFIGTAAGDTLTGNGVTLACPGPAFDFVGGAGVDTIDGSAGTTAECINLALMGNTHEVENAIGGSGDDTITGNALSNVLIGGAGFDVIAAGDGNDFVEGGLGNDTLAGGNGGDTLVYTHATGGMTVDNQLGFTTGPDGQDSLAFFEIVKGSDFDDTIIGGQTSVDANNRFLGRGGDDTLIGTNSTDILNGGAGDDDIYGGGGDDILKGAAGDDLIVAGNGNDVLRGGTGTDTGVGGKGYDVCKSIEHKKSCEA